MRNIFKKKPEIKEEPKIEVKPEKYSQSVYQYLSNEYYSENATKILKLINQAKALSINPSEVCGVSSSKIQAFTRIRECSDKYQKLLGGVDDLLWRYWKGLEIVVQI